jgi:hypothetical protein
VNGDHEQKQEEEDTFSKLDHGPPPDPSQLLPEAPPLSYSKFLTMQSKRAIVSVRYSSEAGLKPYFLTVAKKIKASHPDVVIERRILPPVDEADEATFEILVDGKVVAGNRTRTRRTKSDTMAIFISMQEVDLAISRARRKRRPTTMYGTDDESDVVTRSSYRNNESQK